MLLLIRFSLHPMYPNRYRISACKYLFCLPAVHACRRSCRPVTGRRYMHADVTRIYYSDFITQTCMFVCINVSVTYMHANYLCKIIHNNMNVISIFTLRFTYFPRLYLLILLHINCCAFIISKFHYFPNASLFWANFCSLIL